MGEGGVVSKYLSAFKEAGLYIYFKKNGKHLKFTKILFSLPVQYTVNLSNSLRTIHVCFKPRSPHVLLLQQACEDEGSR